MKIEFYAKITDVKNLRDIFNLDLTDHDLNVSANVVWGPRIGQQAENVIITTQWSGYTYRITTVNMLQHSNKEHAGFMRVQYKGPFNGFLSQNLIPDFSEIKIKYIDSEFYCSYSDLGTYGDKMMTLEEFKKTLQMARSFNKKIVRRYLDTIEDEVLEELAEKNLPFLVKNDKIKLIQSNWFNLYKNLSYLEDIEGFDMEKISPYSKIKYENEEKTVNAYSASDEWYRNKKNALITY